MELHAIVNVDVNVPSANNFPSARNVYLEDTDLSVNSIVH